MSKDTYTYEIVSEVKLSFTLLVELVKDSHGQIKNIKEVVYPSEDEMFDKLVDHLGAKDEAAKPKEKQDDDRYCSGFSLAKLWEEDIKKAGPRWKEGMGQEEVCYFCTYHTECLQAEKDALEALKGVPHGEEKEKKRKDKPFKLCLD